ncbi:MAG TPA: HAMP domain-containing sensor histidine kinase, partial [Longimicrobiales bacterium]
ENARLYAEARRATRVRDEMLAFVSHDLRDPLHTIELSAGLLEAITPLDEETARKQLEIVKRSVQRADRLIDDLLDVARLEAGTFSLECGPVASVEVAREALELHRGQAEKEGERLTAALPERLPDVWADRDRLLQVFSNLLGNAIKFTPRGGRIELGAEAADEHIRFWVRDTGPGIPPDQLPHVFDPFWQAKRRRGGAGLGLAIARGIVEAHGGRIHAESELGMGTTIWFTIPTVKGQRADAGRLPRRRLDAA